MHNNKEDRDGQQHDFNRLIEIAKRYAVRRGMESESEDFAQEYAIRTFESGETRLDYFFADYLRKRFGSSGTACGRLRQFETHGRLSLDADIGSEDGSDSKFGDIIGDSRFSPDSGDEYCDLNSILGAIMNLIKRKEVRDWAYEYYLAYLGEHI